MERRSDAWTCAGDTAGISHSTSSAPTIAAQRRERALITL
jgi:hypothetical protein